MEYIKPNMIELAFGAVITIAFAINRFNTPADQQSIKKMSETQSMLLSPFSHKDNRSSTTAIRFYMTLFIYIAFIAFFYILIACTEIGQQLSSFFKINQISVLSPPLIALLLLTIELSGLPILSSPEKWLRNLLQTMGRIPWEVYRLRENLHESEVELKNTENERIKELAKNFNFDHEQIKSLPAVSKAELLENLLRAKALFEIVPTWKRRSEYSYFLFQNSIWYNNLEDWYQRLERNSLALCKAKIDVEKISAPLKGWETTLNDDAKRLLSHFHEFIARAILKCRFSNAQRKRAFEELGFVKMPATPGLPTRDTVLLFTVILFLFCLNFLIIAETGDSKLPLDKVLKVVIYVALPPVLICYFKDSWEIAKPDDTKIGFSWRPWHFYFLASLITALTTFGISFLIEFCLSKGFEKTITRAIHTFPWHIISFVSAYCLSMQLDSIKKPKWSEKKFAVIQAIVQSLSMSFGGFLALLFLDQINRPSYTEYTPPSYFYVIPTVAFAGAIIGYLVPMSHRAKNELLVKAELKT